MTLPPKIFRLITRGDWVDVRELGTVVWQRLWRQITDRRDSRVARAWAHVEAPPKNWWNIPAVRRRWNLKITRNEEKSPVAWVTERWLTGEGYRALSPGCGTGHREIEWAKSGKFSRIDAFDLSEHRIEYARQQAGEAGVNRVLRFFTANVNQVEFPPGSYDVIIVEDALHHFAPMETVVKRLHSWLKPGGLLVVNEFVGPNRFQWTREQLELATAMLRLLPEHFRRYYRSGNVKQRVYRPGLLRMVLQDPSEAVQSAAILPTIDRYFTVETFRPYGGTLLALVLNGIAHHFIEDTPEVRHWLELLFFVEDYFLEQAGLPSDYVFLVARKTN